MINEQMITRGGKKGFLDDQGNFYPIEEPVTGQGGRPLGSTRPQRPSTSTPETSSTPEPTPKPTPKPTSANANRDGSRGSGLTDAQIKAAQDKANAERAAQQQRGSYSQPIPRGLGLGAKPGEPVIGTPATSPAPAPTPTPTPTPAPQ